MHTYRIAKAGLIAIGLCASFLPMLSTQASAAKSTDSIVYFREIELMDANLLTQTRQTCAMGQMPSIKARIDADKDLQRFDAPFPDADAYCLKVLAVSRSTHHLLDLYINLALQAQGYSDFHSADMAKLLSNNEAGRTMIAILSAAKTGQTTYTGITGKSRDLPCPLALDAGATWADGNDKATPPIALTEAEASAIARQCYAPVSTTITVRGVVMPASKAGLVAGIWLAKH
jgi:hypothetical protein